MNEIKKSKIMSNWIRKNNCFISKTNNNNKRITHLDLTGGKFHISDELYDEFLKTMSTVIDNSEKIFISENRNDIFTYIIDIDYKDEIILSDETLNLFCKLINKVLQDFFDDTYNLKMIVARTDIQKTKNGNNEDVYKSGVHLYFPNLKVNSETAIILRSGLIQQFLLQFGPRPKSNEWEDVIDLSIYKGAGLRMIGNNKTEFCLTCKGKRYTECPVGCFYGKFDGGRPYTYLKTFDTNMNEIYETYTTYEILKETSLVLNCKTSNINITDYPKWFDKECLDEHKNIKRKKNTRVKKNHFSKYNKNQILEIKPDTKFFNLIKTSLICNLKTEKLFFSLENIDITGISVTQSGSTIKSRSYLIKTHIKKCLNVCREHNSNNIYFIINSNGVIYQKCHSESIGYNNIPCSKFYKVLGNIGEIIKKLNNNEEIKINNLSLDIEKTFEENINDLILNNKKDDLREIILNKFNKKNKQEYNRELSNLKKEGKDKLFNEMKKYKIYI